MDCLLDPLIQALGTSVLGTHSKPVDESRLTQMQLRKLYGGRKSAGSERRRHSALGQLSCNCFEKDQAGNPVKPAA